MQPLFEESDELVFEGAAVCRWRQFLAKPALVEYLQHLVQELAHFRGVVALVDLVGLREVGEAVEAELGRAAHVHVESARRYLPLKQGVHFRAHARIAGEIENPVGRSHGGKLYGRQAQGRLAAPAR